MQRLIRWLNVEARGAKLIGMVTGATLAGIVLCKLTLLALILAGYYPPAVPGAHALLNEGPVGWIVTLLGLSAISEEFFFRAPLFAIGKACSRTVTLGAAAGLSIIFGLLHGGLAHIPLQGVLGFILSLVFLKCGGLQCNFYKALAASSATHFLYNMGVVAIGRWPL